MRCEIICVGTELLLGEIVNTNASWLAARFSEIGLTHYHQSVVGDNLGRIKSVIQTALSRSDLIFFSGGLGPTADDITHEAIADSLGLKLVQYPEAVTELEKKYANLGRAPSQSNYRQTYLPEGSNIVNNPTGTANGVELKVSYEGRERIIFTFPGVPSELKAMYAGEVLPRLKAANAVSGAIEKTDIMVFGMPESVVGEKIAGLIANNNPSVATYASVSGVRIRVSSSEGAARQNIDQTKDKIIEALGDHVISADGRGLGQVFVDDFKKRGLSFSTAESCTGGGIGEMITSVPGSSEVYEGGVVSYSNAIKVSMLGVLEETLRTEGAVSEAVAKQMSEGMLSRSRADFSVAVTGIAGPSGGRPGKPVGTVCFGLSEKQTGKTIAFTKNFGSRPRKTIRYLAVMTSLFAVYLAARESPLLESLFLNKSES